MGNMTVIIVLCSSFQFLTNFNYYTDCSCSNFANKFFMCINADICTYYFTDCCFKYQIFSHICKSIKKYKGLVLPKNFSFFTVIRHEIRSNKGFLATF